MRRTNDTGRKERFEALYRRYNHREYVHPDPLEFLYKYPDLRDREVVGMVAASLAYGRVRQIVKSVSIVLDRMGGAPYRFVRESTDAKKYSTFRGFVHRFATGKDVARFLIGIRGVIEQYGSLHEAFRRLVRPEDKNIFSPMAGLCRSISDAAGGDLGHLLPLPERGSACKRMNLFLRWMVRKDAVDPGGWDSVSADGLIVPLDVHMHRIGRELGFTARKQADMKTALEITDGFKRYSPEDPVRYDFVLTRPGIWGDTTNSDFFM